MRPFMVNPGPEIYLTDFQESTFAGEIAKNRGLGAKMALNATRVYHAGVNYAAVLRKSELVIARGIAPKQSKSHELGRVASTPWIATAAKAASR